MGLFVNSPHPTTQQIDNNTEIEQDKLINEPLTFILKGLKAYHPFLLKEKKLTKETINHFDLGFCSKGLLVG